MSVNTKVNGQLVKSAGLYTVTKPIGMADIYSTEEKEVGLWVDNRPLYQKTYVFGADVTVSHENFTNLTAFTIPTDIDYIRNAECFRIGNKGLLSIDCALIASGGSTYIAIRNSSAYDITVASGSTLTITYTKTSDTPWSGKFVPQGYGYVSSGDVYSFEERRIGVWTDGKPLYQKTVDVGALPNNGRKEVAHNIANIDTVVSSIGIMGNGTSFAFIPYVSTGTQYQVPVDVNKTNIVITTGQDRSGFTGYVTIKYTKTTDVPGSGEYVPSGDKAEHYSTNEEVIGTWINGETLYRKTITGLSIQLNGTTWVNYNPNISIDKLINVHAYYEPSGGLMTCAIAEYQYNPSVGIQLTAVQNYNRTVNILTIEYTKTS